MLNAKKTWFFIFSMLCALIIGCSDHEKKQHIPDNINISVRFNYLHKDLFEKKQDSFSLELTKIKDQYDDFFKIYVQNILNLGNIDDPALIMYLTTFCKDENVKQLYADVQKMYPNLYELQTEINKAFNRYHYVFPNHIIPNVIFFISGFNYYYHPTIPFKIVATEKSVGIGLDMYLGKKYEPYQSFGFPIYLSETMDSTYILSDVIKGWLYTEYDTLFKDNLSLIERSIEEGKLMYILHLLLPDKPEYQLFGFTESKMHWCIKEEKQIWTYLIDENLLHSNNPAVVSPFFMEGPFTKNLPKESPAKAITYIGYNIVQAYMNNYPNTPIDRLLKTTPELIFSKSKYKPKK